MKPKFHAFNKHAEVGIYHRNLPHWRQKGATYFTTFRLADSIPRSILEKWNHERNVWLEANGVLKTLTPEQRTAAYLSIDTQRRRNFERENARKLYLELDQGHGCCIFRHPDCRTILSESMFHFHGKRYWAGDFVIMPNHVHWIIQPLEKHPLETILQSIKRFVSTRISKQGLADKGRLWQSESHDHIIRNADELRRIRKYIGANPEIAGFPYSSYELHRADWLD